MDIVLLALAGLAGLIGGALLAVSTVPKSRTTHFSIQARTYRVYLIRGRRRRQRLRDVIQRDPESVDQCVMTEGYPDGERATQDVGADAAGTAMASLRIG